jgi:hypothetical protein
MNSRILTIGSLFFLVSCGTTVINSDIPCPPRPFLEGFVASELNSMTDEAKRKAAQNQIKLKAYAKKLEVRAGCNET